MDESIKIKISMLREESPAEVKDRIEQSIIEMERGNYISFTGDEFVQLSMILRDQ